VKGRTPLAIVLAAAAVATPCTAWYVAGSREAAREAQALREEPRRRATEAGRALAERLRERLESLRQEESRRPYYHYQRLYHDPRGISSGLSLVPSPLSEGPADALVQAHFQVDARGRITAPTPVSREAAVRGALQPAAALFTRRIATLDVTPVRIPAPAPTPEPTPTPDAAQAQVQQLDQRAYLQNRVAQTFDSRSSARSQLPAVSAAAPPVTIRLGPLEWQALPSSGGSVPGALREVITPDGAVLQGFTLSAAALDDTLKGAAFPARFREGAPAAPWDALLSLDGTAWHVSLELGAAEREAEARAAQALSSFRGAALAVGLAAALAGIALVALVWQAERLAKQRSHLAAAAAHELRTPLTGLRMYSEMLAEGLGDPGKREDYARRVAGEASRLGRVVTNLLGFTHLERGRLRVEPRAGDLGAAVRADVQRQEPALRAAGACVDLEIAEGLPPVSFDPDALSQILQNLLDNAEKYSRGAADRGLQVRVERHAGGARVSVTDRGPGIPPAVARRLFHPFRRAAPDGAPEGLGLGLALVQALARAHGGSAAVEAAPGGGTTVTVTLPLAAS
jgi:signal transduction histidine kinase